MKLQRQAFAVLALSGLIAAGCSDSAGTDSERGEPGMPVLPANFETGKATYDAGCASCHDSSRDGAPRLGFLAAWKRRLDKGEEQLISNAISGIELMPPRGENPDLTDEQVAGAVRYMMYRAKLDIPAGH